MLHLRTQFSNLSVWQVNKSVTNEDTFRTSVFLTMSNTTVTVDGSPVLNPFSWSAFLPPDVAAEVNVESFILAGVAGVRVSLCWVNGRADEHQAFVWDILNNIREDYILVTRRSRLGLPIIIYVLSKYAHLILFFFRSKLNLSCSRLCTFAYVIVSAIFQSEWDDFSPRQILTSI